MASKQILDKFLKASAGAESVKKALELHQMMMESDEDSSSTGSDFGQLWGLGTKRDNPEYDDSSTDDPSMDDSESDTDSDSSIEILSPSSRQKSISSPVGRGMNGRHLSGRQRRLEAARSKNSAVRLYDDGENSEGDDSSIDHDDDNSYDDSDDVGVNMVIVGVVDKDVNGAVLSGDDSDDVLSGAQADKAKKPGEPAPNESDGSNESGANTALSSTDLHVQNSISTDIASEETISESQNAKARDKSHTISRNSTVVNGIDANLMNNEKSILPEVNTKASLNQSNNNVPKEVQKTVAGRGKMATKSALTTSKKAKQVPKTKMTKESGVFDNLFCNGKDFFAWAGITDPHDFLRRSKEYAKQVNLWRKDRKQPPFTDTTGYITGLRKQVRDNMKTIAANAKKQGSRKSSDSKGDQKVLDAKEKSMKRRKKKRKSNYTLTKDLPNEGADFLKYMEIDNIEDIFKHKGLHKHINPWRKSRKLPPVNDEHSCIANWRKWIRQNMKQKPDTKEDTPDEIDFSNCMKVVDSLSKRFLNSETGLPVYQFAVYDNLSTGT
jgi:hypothetical protein